MLHPNRFTRMLNDITGILDVHDQGINIFPVHQRREIAVKREDVVHRTRLDRRAITQSNFFNYELKIMVASLNCICGQSASVYGVKAEHLIEGVELELSAMTAHALLQQRGYTVNPF